MAENGELSNNGKLTTQNILMGAAVGLIGLGVAGVWNMGRSVSALEERVSTWTRIYEQRFERLDSEFQMLRRELPRYKVPQP